MWCIVCIIMYSGWGGRVGEYKKVGFLVLAEDADTFLRYAG